MTVTDVAREAGCSQATVASFSCNETIKICRRCASACSLPRALGYSSAAAPVFVPAEVELGTGEMIDLP